MIPLVLLPVIAPLKGDAAPHDTDGFDAPKIFEGRIIFGTNFTQVDGDTYAGYHKVGLNAGGMVYVHFTPSFGTSLELLYSQKGVRGGEIRESYTLGTYIDKYSLNLNYAEADLMLHYDSYVMDYEAGISYSRLISSKEWAQADVPIYFNPALYYFNDYDLEYVMGLSIRVLKRWRLNMRYQYSIKTIRPQERVLQRYNNGQGQYNEVAVLRLIYTL